MERAFREGDRVLVKPRNVTGDVVDVDGKRLWIMLDARGGSHVRELILSYEDSVEVLS